MSALVWRVIAVLSRVRGKLHVVALQTVHVDDAFKDSDLILDLGGGGEGVIGQLRGRQVVAIDLRKGELDDAPTGPVKVVADARHLPFPDASFEAATAFFFLMYVAAADRRAVLREACRALVPGGSLHIWDVAIPAPGERAAKTFVVPICAMLPGRTVRTGYGVPWRGREMSPTSVADLLHETGFEVRALEESGRTFHIVAVKPNSA